MYAQKYRLDVLIKQTSKFGNIIISITTFHTILPQISKWKNVYWMDINHQISSHPESPLFLCSIFAAIPISLIGYNIIVNWTKFHGGKSCRGRSIRVLLSSINPCTCTYAHNNTLRSVPHGYPMLCVIHMYVTIWFDIYSPFTLKSHYNFRMLHLISSSIAMQCNLYIVAHL